MKYNPNKHHRRSIRIDGFDYSSHGAYFITICSHDRSCVFGEIIHDRVVLNKYGNIVVDEWMKSAQIRDEIQLDEFVVMPNHFHGIVWIVGNESVGAYGHTPLPYVNTPMSTNVFRFEPVSKKFVSPSRTVGSMVRGFKAGVTIRVHKEEEALYGPIWQRNYWERFIRDEIELNHIREYVRDNPKKWEADSLFPDGNL